jgi:hypothetical protein
VKVTSTNSSKQFNVNTLCEVRIHISLYLTKHSHRGTFLNESCAKLTGMVQPEAVEVPSNFHVNSILFMKVRVKLKEPG